MTGNKFDPSKSVCISVSGYNIKADSDGQLSNLNNKIITSGASQTRINFNDDVLEIEGGDIDANGIVSKGSVTLNGNPVEKNSTLGVDLSLVEGIVGKAYTKSEPGYGLRC